MFIFSLKWITREPFADSLNVLQSFGRGCIHVAFIFAKLNHICNGSMGPIIIKVVISNPTFARCVESLSKTHSHLVPLPRWKKGNRLCWTLSHFENGRDVTCVFYVRTETHPLLSSRSKIRTKRDYKKVGLKHLHACRDALWHHINCKSGTKFRRGLVNLWHSLSAKAT